MKLLRDDAAVSAYYSNYYLSEHDDYFSDARSRFEVEALRSWFGGRPNSVCDVACGHGRHLLAFARMGVETGYGFDAAKKLVHIAKRNLASYHYRVECATFAAWNVGVSRFDIVYSLFSSIGYCLEENEIISLIRKMVSAAKRGGIVCVDIDNIHRIKRFLQSEGNTDEQNEYSFDDETRILLGRERRENKMLETKTRFYTDEELKGYFVHAGLSNVKCYGAFDTSPYTKNSGRLIVVGRK